MSDEQWRPVVGYEGLYKVSDHGRVRGARGVLRPGQSQGYPKVELHAGGRRRTRRVHLLVAAAFLGPCPAGLEVRHVDGDRTHPQVSNLRYGTHSQNVRDSIAHGTHGSTRKRACKRGHPLLPPNLRPSDLARGVRACKACHRATEYVRLHGGDVALIAGAFYREDRVMAAEIRAIGLSEEQATAYLDELQSRGFHGAAVTPTDAEGESRAVDVRIGLDEATDAASLETWLEGQHVEHRIEQSGVVEP